MDFSEEHYISFFPLCLTFAQDPYACLSLPYTHVQIHAKAATEALAGVRNKPVTDTFTGSLKVQCHAYILLLVQKQRMIWG